ncbi:MAG: hypothetical protein H6618_10045 [Deltaproteobacteria bacterium]|nr:hypothetical protein [Deltaproteobacteria bacterium]MCB9229941.1 hypothetical protein [Deltaproteobacteria bacterium]
MPSEKSRYLKKRKGPIFDLNEVEEHLQKLSSKDLAKTLALAGSWDNEIVGKINQLKVGFAVYGPDEIEEQLKLIDYALEISDWVSYDRCSPYCQILHVANSCLKQFYSQYGVADIIKLADRVIERGQISAELLDDPAYWEMAIDDICKWRDSLKSL